MGSPTCVCVSARRQEGYKGKTVKIRRGPAAVIGDEHRKLVASDNLMFLLQSLIIS